MVAIQRMCSGGGCGLKSRTVANEKKGPRGNRDSQNRHQTIDHKRAGGDFTKNVEFSDRGGRTCPRARVLHKKKKSCEKIGVLGISEKVEENKKGLGMPTLETLRGKERCQCRNFSQGWTRNRRWKHRIYQKKKKVKRLSLEEKMWRRRKES